MTTDIVAPPVEAPQSLPTTAVLGDKTLTKSVNGKFWQDRKTAFRPAGGLSSYEQRQVKRKEMEMAKILEKELRDEKEAKRQSLIQRIKDRRDSKAEREHYKLLSEKMHHKRVERLRRREKRNKMINS